MKFQFLQPSIYLRNYVKHYCFMESEACEQNVRERVIPTESIQLMFHYRQPFVVLKEDKIVSYQPQSIISGLSNSFSDVSTFGAAGVVFVAFQPVGACHFFRFPLSEIENQSLDMKDIFSKEIKEVEEKLYCKTNFEERAKVIDSFLLKKMSVVKQHDYLLLQKGVKLIKQNRGQMNTAALSTQLFATSKSLERKFSAFLGMTPKQYFKLIRFQSTIEDMTLRKGIPLTDFAYSNGYSDQSHFIRDFKTFSGFTPKEFIVRYADCGLNTDLETF